MKYHLGFRGERAVDGRPVELALIPNPSHLEVANPVLAGVARAQPGADPAWVARVVELVRRTREHPDLRVGSSVRGAIDASAVVASLADLRGRREIDRGVGLDAVLVALSGRIRLREGALRTPEEILTELYDEVFGPPATSEPGADADATRGKAEAPTGPHRA